MSSKTKIIVLHMKEIIYTMIFLLLAIVLGLLLFFMFGPGQSAGSRSDSPKYTAGIYRSAVSLGENSFDVEVTVDSNKIRAIHLVNLSESTAAMFPLMEPALESLCSQIYATQSLENIEFPDDQKYTSAMLLNAISSAISQAAVSP